MLSATQRRTLGAAAVVALAAGTVTGLPGPAAAATINPVVETYDFTSGPDGRGDWAARPAPPRFTDENGVTARVKPGADLSPAAPAKISPRLMELRAAAAMTAVDRPVPVIVTFVDDVTIPAFPAIDQSQPDAAPVNVAVREQGRRLVDTITAQRAPGYRSITADIQRLGGTVLGSYWLTKGVYAQIPFTAIDALVARTDVQYVEPARGGELPPANDNEAAARALLGTDPYFGLARSGDRIALLDTGVDVNHPLLTGVIGTGFDFTDDNDPFTDPCNHGTKSAGVLSGNNSSGDGYRGVSDIKINIYKIYPTGGEAPCGLDVDAAERAVQQAASTGEKLIVVETQSHTSAEGGLATAADNAFDAGAVVISAAGNSGDGTTANTVTAPGNARKVLGVGAVDVTTFAPYPKQGQGPTPDGRFKPDLVAPTNVDTASANNGLAIYDGTSAATAEAGGAAAVLRTWLRGSSPTILPGYVYASMILGGSHPGSLGFNNVEGAGKLKLSPLPPAGKFSRSHTITSAGTTIGTSTYFTVPKELTGCRLSAALWWDDVPGVHNDYDLKLIDPTGVVRAESTSAASVFELARVTGPLVEGTWTVKEYPYRPIVATTPDNKSHSYSAVSLCR